MLLYLNNLENFTWVFLISLFQNNFEKNKLLYKALQNFLNDTGFCHNSIVECVSYMRKLKGDKTYNYT